MNNIVLIGFMGTGKTTSGHMLADALGWDFIDIDCQIEKKCNMSVAGIFAQYGEEYFRQQERDLIQELAEQSRNAVIATGGGAIKSDENIKNLKKCGPIICLIASPETIVKRLEHDRDSRPLLKSHDRLERVTHLLAERRTRYQQADLCIDTDGLTPEDVTKIIKKFIS